MRVWLREILGVVLILAGLGAGGGCLWFLSAGLVIEGGIALPLAAVLVGAGTHLLKVAMAVRILLRDQAQYR